MPKKRVTLEAMLRARENRAKLQNELISRYSCSVVSYTLNIAGPLKRFPPGDRSFYVGKMEIEKQLASNGWTAAESVLTDAATGLECLWAVDADFAKLKSAMAALEERHPLGRLFDVDVIARDGVKVSRDMVGLPERACIVCGKPGMGCARSREHPLDEIQSRARSIIDNYFQQTDARFIGQNAVRALLYEISVTPKPGLVDRCNNGAHNDMDFFTFMDSAAVLSDYFHEAAATGAANRGAPPDKLLGPLRCLGVAAEEEMLSATGGVNTHKGLIFSLGIVCAALGYHGAPFPSPDTVLQTAAEIASPALRIDLAGITPQNAATHGEAAYAKYGVSGVRGEAASAFPSVRLWGLPALQKALRNGNSYNDAGVEALLHLVAHVTDTNIISRSNHETLKKLQTDLRAFLDTKQDNAAVLEYAALLDERFIKGNISPGGCADLLAISYMLHFMTNVGPFDAKYAWAGLCDQFEHANEKISAGT
jgi:holo-ACP synthase/triphosphoribosyl-dephospho-CoA synthase